MKTFATHAQPLTLRFDASGQVWALNKRATGFASFGYSFAFLGEALDACEVVLSGFGRDAHGLYLEAVPR
jgi:hypothetical protein